MTWKSSITDEQLKSVVRDCDPKKMSGMAAEAISTDALYELAYELLQLRRSVQSETIQSGQEREPTPIGLFWQTADRRWHFSPGSLNRGDIHDNGRPIHIALLGEEAK